MSSASDFADRLNAKPAGAGWMARCPAHDDRTASLSINARAAGCCCTAMLAVTFETS
jgi:hypothetical protein